MSQNPLLGKRISLISIKNIRYEGVLYSINEQNSTLALQNVKSFGTEGREPQNEIAPSDAVHPFLLFRGQDIKDLHVHEETTAPTPTPPVPATAPPPAPQPLQPQSTAPQPAVAPKSMPQQVHQQQKPKSQQNRSSSSSNNNNNKAAVGTGASLLGRTERGATNNAIEPTKPDFDFSVQLEDDHDDDDAGDNPVAYAKDDFFDSISCEATDKEQGINNRLKGATERRLNTETFGAVALNNNHRRRRGGGGRGRGGRGGRGRGGRGRGRQQTASTSS